MVTYDYRVTLPVLLELVKKGCRFKDEVLITVRASFKVRFMTCKTFFSNVLALTSDDFLYSGSYQRNQGAAVIVAATRQLPRVYDL